MLDIIYEDDQVIVCLKPAGIATQTARATAKDMVSLLRNYRAAKKEPVYIGLVHRLDQPVEGLMVFAKNQQAAGILSKEMSGNHIHKQYQAICIGQMPDRGECRDWLLKDGRSNTSSVVAKGTKGAKEARLSYQVLERQQDEDTTYNLVLVQLETGRHHQIRVQLSYNGWPILGDSKYGSLQNADLRNAGQRTGLALCSVNLGFTHPVTGKKMTFSCQPKGKAFERFLSQKDFSL